MPVLVLRDTTERPEGVDAGTLRLIGTDGADVERALRELLTNEELYQSMSLASNPYGEGESAVRILEAIAYSFEQIEERPQDFLI